jgi:hypothetical protein
MAVVRSEPVTEYQGIRGLEIKVRINHCLIRSVRKVEFPDYSRSAIGVDIPPGPDTIRRLDELKGAGCPSVVASLAKESPLLFKVREHLQTPSDTYKHEYS